ncbi:MAG: hypothetical protein ACRBBN_00245 [Methyloligellaceae bacterium]
MNRFLLSGLVGLMGLAGCQTLPKQTAEIIGHPANPSSKQGKALAVTKVLDERDDLTDPFQPRSRSNPVPGNTQEDHSAHKMHKH